MWCGTHLKHHCLQINVFLVDYSDLPVFQNPGLFFVQKPGKKVIQFSCSSMLELNPDWFLVKASRGAYYSLWMERSTYSIRPWSLLSWRFLLILQGTPKNAKVDLELSFIKINIVSLCDNFWAKKTNLSHFTLCVSCCIVVHVCSMNWHQHSDPSWSDD